MSAPYSVLSYSIKNLRDILHRSDGVDCAAVDGKLHLVYFEEYFAVLKAKTIVVEKDYVDRDFLEDYVGYYVRCFAKYRRKCQRLHFFSVGFTIDDLKNFLQGNLSSVDENKLRNSYLGFVVLKPLPKTIFGRTCLRTYGRDGGRRHYSSTQVMSPHLFGISLKVNTLPFQEQDSVVAACATSALWSVFHGCGYFLQHSVPSPVEITKTATSLLPLETRSLPSKGLTPAQMAYAIRDVGLEPFLVDAANLTTLKETAYAYLRGGFPLILIVDLVDTSFVADTSNQPGKYLGRHAVAVTGFSLNNAGSVVVQHVSPGTESLLMAVKMDKLYVHDDQVGPFARMTFDGVKTAFELHGNSCSRESISTSWRGADGNIGSIRALANILLIPLYHKIRIPFGVIRDHVHCIDAFIETLRQAQTVLLQKRIEWDVYLTTVNQYKSEVLKSETHNGNKQTVLTSSLPKFIWLAKAKIDQRPLTDLLFDATDIEQASLLTMIVPYDSSFMDALMRAYNGMSQSAREHPALTAMGWIAKKYPLPQDSP